MYNFLILILFIINPARYHGLDTKQDMKYIPDTVLSPLVDGRDTTYAKETVLFEGSRCDCCTRSIRVMKAPSGSIVEGMNYLNRTDHSEVDSVYTDTTSSLRYSTRGSLSNIYDWVAIKGPKGDFESDTGGHGATRSQVVLDADPGATVLLVCGAAGLS